MRALRSFELVVGTLGVTALLGGVAVPLPASAQWLEFEEEGELELAPPDVSFVPPSLTPAPRYDLEEHLDRLSSPAPLTGGTARLHFTTPRGFRVYSERSLTLGPSFGLAPVPGTIDLRAATERYQLRIDTPGRWSLLAELAVVDPRLNTGARLRSYFVGVMAPPRRRVRMGFGAWGGGGGQAFGFVLRW